MPKSPGSTMQNRFAARDGLTAAFTRAYLLALLADECRFSLEVGRPFSVCLVDIDALRKVNEECGIAAGDAALADTAETVRATLDSPQWSNLRCLIGRYDSDALMLLLPGTRLDRTERFAHVIRQRIASLCAAGTPITASIAVVAFKPDDSIDTLLVRAEKTLCLAKQFGGNCVEVSRTTELTRDLASVTRLPVAWRQPKRTA